MGYYIAILYDKLIKKYRGVIEIDVSLHIVIQVYLNLFQLTNETIAI